MTKKLTVRCKMLDDTVTTITMYSGDVINLEYTENHFWLTTQNLPERLIKTKSLDWEPDDGNYETQLTLRPDINKKEINNIKEDAVEELLYFMEDEGFNEEEQERLIATFEDLLKYKIIDDRRKLFEIEEWKYWWEGDEQWNI